ncbi:permease [Cognatishimia activa]|uniref:Putative permease n=1 Tax=Cognatishimia activa TaxID=1715691 RepID=A0A0P1IRS7_9RHOB|nr:permease [Cognatishimia activa]CUJ01573.1 putative permease [Cognatishimia activa]CUK26169.1 putative permease [Cognatishimia activa]
MADTTHSPAPHLFRRVDKAWLALVLILVAVAVFDRPQFIPTVSFATNAVLGTAPFIAFAVMAIAYLKATGAENVLAKAFVGKESRMIVFAALLGGLAPFCSCEVIPFIAALLAAGTPLSAVMAFWLASPLMDPAMFSITAGQLGFDFAIAKTASAVGLGLFGGFMTMWFAKSSVFADPLREKPQVGGCCGVKAPFSETPVWKFWGDDTRRTVFRETAIENAVFLLKWLALAYTVEALMIHYVPASWIANVLGGEGLQPIALGALVGAPAYLNGYAAVPLVDALLLQGMAPGAAMSFMIAGGVSSVPAAIAVWALVKPRVFGAYLGLAMVGAFMAGISWQFIA